MPYSVLVSHTNMDAKLAEKVTASLDQALEGRVTLKLAQAHIETGAQWRAWIREHLESCDMVLSIFTPEAVNKPWLYVEWVPFWLNHGEKDFIILLANGVKPQSLISPMLDSQTVSLDDEASVYGLLRTLAKRAEPPLEEGELRERAQSIVEAAAEGRRGDLAQSAERYADPNGQLPADDQADADTFRNLETDERKELLGADLLTDLRATPPAAVNPPGLVNGRTARGAPDVSISYSWADSAIADEIDAVLAARGIRLTRDVRDVPYRADIPEFMERLGRAGKVVMLISDAYLKSRNCMFEALEFLEHGDFRGRAVPVVLSDAAAIYDAAGSAGYLEFWGARVQELNARLKALPSLENAGRIVAELDHCARIRASIDGFVEQVQRMNVLTPQAHRDAGWRHVIEAVRPVG